MSRTEDREFLIRLAPLGAVRLLPQVSWEKGWTTNSLSNEWKGAGRDLLELCQAAAGADHAFPQARQLPRQQDPGLRSAPRRSSRPCAPTGVLSAAPACCRAASPASGASTARCATIAAPCRTARRCRGSPARRPSGPDPCTKVIGGHTSITFNEADKIEAAVASVLWADEIVVVDSFSTDRTAEIATALGARVVAGAVQRLRRLAQPRRRSLHTRLDLQPGRRRTLHRGGARRNPGADRRHAAARRLSACRAAAT